MYDGLVLNACHKQGRMKGEGRGAEDSDEPPRFSLFLRANLIHFLYKVFGKRSVQK